MVIVFPSASAQLAFAAGLGREALSICAEPRTAIKPRARHPAAKTANCFLIFFSPSGLCANIEPNLRFERKLELFQTYQTACAPTCLTPRHGGACESWKKGLNLGIVRSCAESRNRSGRYLWSIQDAAC